MKKIEPVDIIIPTWNNGQILGQCISSMLATNLYYPFRLLIVNNGHPNSCDFIPPHPMVEIVQTGGQNLGWEGGLKKGLERSTSKYVGFMNDDIFVPVSSCQWLRLMMSMFTLPQVGIVGPASNCVMGSQNIWKPLAHAIIETSYLIGFCMLVSREALDKVGGIDDTLPGGDDMDMSIRMRTNGYKLVCRRDVFVYHHGFVTGNRLHGDQAKEGGWNSTKMGEKTNMALIKKHGFKNWFQCIAGLSYPGLQKGDDWEGDAIRKHVVGEKVLDLGCANNKTVPHAVGVDAVKRGEKVPNLNAVSEADVVADVEYDLPFEEVSQDTIIARHILEHCIDPIKTIQDWAKYLKPGGRLIIGVPDENAMRTIAMNPEHLHAYKPETLKRMVEMCGLKTVSVDATAGPTVIGVFQKPVSQECSCHRELEKCG